MDPLKRKPLQGTWNIIRFNWHFYAIAFTIVFSLFILSEVFLKRTPFITILLFLPVFGMLVSLIVSFYIYDLSGFYSFKWLPTNKDQRQHIININAGFDETSWTIQHKFPGSQLTVMDFYNPRKHTELSIKRARKAYPAYPGTLKINTDTNHLTSKPADYIFLVFAAHEIRDNNERISFFRTLAETLKPGGQLIIVEHQRDLLNFLAYNIGFLHFLSKRTWLNTFYHAGLTQISKFKVNPFVSTFIIKKNGTTA